MSYIHLNQEERYQIYAYQNSDNSPSEIALLLERSKQGVRTCIHGVLELCMIVFSKY